MTEQQPTARCTYREPGGTVCGRLLTDPASVERKLGRVHRRRLRKLVRSACRRRRVVAVYEGQLVLDLDGDLEHCHAEHAVAR